jgi:hypothetical protein
LIAKEKTVNFTLAKSARCYLNYGTKIT